MDQTAVMIKNTPQADNTLFGMPEGQDARALADRARALVPEDRALLHVATDDARAAALCELLAFFAPDVEILYFPAWDCLPYDRVSPHGEIVARRVAALCRMLDWAEEKKRYPRLVVTTVAAALQRVTPQAALAGAALSAKAGGALPPARLETFLRRNGYVRAETVREPGEYALRGSIADLFPPGVDEPLRLDFFGEEIETIRAFDPASQITTRKLDGFTLRPAAEFFLDAESIARFRAGYREHFGAVRDGDPLYEAVSAGRRYNGMDHWLPLFFERTDTLFGYLPGAEITLDHNGPAALQDRLAQIADFHAARKTLEDAAGKKKKVEDVSLTGSAYHPLPPDLLYLRGSEWPDGALHLSPFAAPEGESGGESAAAKKGRDFSDVRALPDGDLFGELARHASAMRQEGRKILIACYSPGSRERLRGLMEQAGFSRLKDCGGAEDLKKLDAGETGLAVLALAHGFAAPDLAVLTEQDILGDRLARRSERRRKKADNFLTEISSLSPGDLVVHIDHGVGRFEGLETVAAGGALHDCLKIVYAGDDRLFVPVENIDVLTRFGSDEGAVQLDKMGGAGWQARKARVKKDLMAIADHLLAIAAKRQLQKAEPFAAGFSFQEFSARFPYQETEDQARAIEAVLDDLHKGVPMDRLVCGDVGFGKTEVALRAAYVAASGGAQVAVAVPTTLLARQHYRNFSERFAGTGLRVAQLSRLVPPNEAKKVKEGLKDGSINVVVGTHALFAKDTGFRHLGLMIVDEEQRFGVKQKERLKEMKAGVHVLTLTATPIPRTLQMALSGVRDMSLIATPPVDRLAIRTFVLPYDPVVIREALLREHYRGGQSFYVCPRISDLTDVEEALKDLVPEVKLVSAHGQMPPAELEDRMTAFYEGRYDVLLATNIIESGLDIPRANTMIVHRADMFGLAQLYQIRGRIGRSKLRAYACLTYDPGKKLTAQGQRRLEVIETLDTLGAGFQLASHDMDIRGAGNLLGEEQSGHIREVGVELYQQMLEEAVAAAREGLDFAKGEPLPDRWSPQINAGLSILIPDHYVADLNVRMSLYRRLTELEDQNGIESFAAELIDRFGRLPDEVENLLHIVAIKQLCRRAGVERLDAGPKGAVVSFRNNAPPDVPALLRWIQEKGGVAVRLRPDQKLVVTREWSDPARRIKSAKSLMKELADLR